MGKLQGELNQNLLMEMAVSLKICISNPMLPPLKPILALPTQGQKCILSELQPFEVATFDLGHPVDYSNNNEKQV